MLIRYVDLHPVSSRSSRGSVSISISSEVERAIGKYVLSRHGNTIIKKMLDYLESEVGKEEYYEEDKEYF